jgi:hypothetical protein
MATVIGIPGYSSMFARCRPTKVGVQQYAAMLQAVA